LFQTQRVYPDWWREEPGVNSFELLQDTLIHFNVIALDPPSRFKQILLRARRAVVQNAPHPRESTFDLSFTYGHLEEERCHLGKGHL
jgi:hypothetical protein